MFSNDQRRKSLTSFADIAVGDGGVATSGGASVGDDGAGVGSTAVESIVDAVVVGCCGCCCC